MSKEFESLLQEATPKVADIALKTKAVLQEVMPNIVEVVWPKQKNIGYGVGPKKMSEHFCYIALLKDRINLGFFYGADLDDPKGLLEGTGKKLRHIKVTSTEQLDDPALKALVKKASNHLPNLKK